MRRFGCLLEVNYCQWAVVAALGATGVLGCGGRPASVPPSSSPATVEVAAPQSSPVERHAAPQGLFMVGRVVRATTVATRLAEWCNIPFDLEDGLTAMAGEARKYILADEPVDFAFSLPQQTAEAEPSYAPEAFEGDAGGAFEGRSPKVNGIVSFAVSEPESLVRELKKAGRAVRPSPTGEVTIELNEAFVCSLGPALGASKHRLACGDSDADLELLAGFARTELATLDLPRKAAYLEVRMEPLRTRYGTELRDWRKTLPALIEEWSLQSERFDRALSRVIRASADEMLAWVDGGDKWTFALDLAPDEDGLVGETTFSFRNDGSYLAQLLRRRTKEATTAPPMFWDLPKGVDAASFSTAASLTDEDRVIARVLTDLVGGALEHWGVASGTTEAWVKDLQQLWETRPTMVVASGVVESAAGQPSSKTYAPYYLLGIEGDDGSYARVWRGLVALLDDKKLRSELAQRLEVGALELPVVRSKSVARTNTAPAMEHYQVSVNSPAIQTLAKRPLHVVLASDGSRTWIGIGFDEGAALTSVGQALATEPGSKLASRSDLAPLGDRQALVGSFNTVRGHLKWLSLLPLVGATDSFTERLLRTMPHRGATPTFVEVTTSTEGPSVTLRLEAPREVFADWSALTFALTYEVIQPFMRLFPR
jgi:hypothetical protein